MTDPEPRWGFEEAVDESLFEDRLARPRHRESPSLDLGPYRLSRFAEGTSFPETLIL